MSDAIILAGTNHVTDLDAADDFQKKHTPYLRVEQLDGAARVTAHVGHYVPHPNQADHFIQWIEFQVDGAPIARFDLSPMAVNPEVSAIVVLDPGTVLTAVEFCNLHGLWSAQVTV